MGCAMKRWILSIGVAAALTVPVLAQDFAKGVDAYNKGHYAAALYEWTPLAEQGDAKAQFMLGQMYREGKGVEQDDGEAMRWFRKSAQGGNASAGYWIGRYYEAGILVQRNGQEAVRWYKMAAEAGNVPSILRLVDLYNSGEIVPPDPAEALRWTEAGARKGQMSLQLAAGIHYAGDAASPGQRAKAEMWLKLAENPSERDNDGNLNYQQPSERRRTVAIAKLLLGELRDGASDHQAALTYYLDSAELGNPSAQWQIAKILDEGSHGQAVDRVHAFMWLSIALAHCGPEDGFLAQTIKIRRADMMSELSVDEITKAQTLAAQKHIPNYSENPDHPDEDRTPKRRERRARPDVRL